MSLRSLCALVFIVTTSLVATIASAQSFNVDAGTSAGVPSSSYGAAAASPGPWNAYLGGNLSNLVDVGGNVTSVSIAGTGGFLSSINDPNTFGDDEALLDDFLFIPVSEQYTISGLVPGTYDVYTYGWFDNPLTSDVSVNGSAFQTLGGPWPGGFLQGTTHALNNVSILSGQDIIITVNSAGGGLGPFNGFQVVQAVPAPSALLLLALPGLVRRRNRS